MPPLAFSAPFEFGGVTRPQTVEISVALPGAATYAPGTAILVTAGQEIPVEPVVEGNRLIWTLVGIESQAASELRFDATPTVTLGATNLTSTARVVGTETVATSTTSVNVIEPLETNDFSGPDRRADTTDVDEDNDTVYLTYISDEVDNDVFRVTVDEGDELAIRLSGLSADLDLALYGDPTDDDGVALSGASDEAPIQPITDPDQTGANAEPVNDFRRLDDEDNALQFLEVSNARGDEAELLVTDPLPAGDYFVQVYGANGDRSPEPAALQIQVLEAETRPACAPVGAMSTSRAVHAPIGSDVNTLFVVNQQRMEHFYPADGLAAVTAVQDFADWLNGPEGPAAVTAGVLSIDAPDPDDITDSVQAAYNAWDADGNCTPRVGQRRGGGHQPATGPLPGTTRPPGRGRRRSDRPDGPAARRDRGGQRVRVPPRAGRSEPGRRGPRPAQRPDGIVLGPGLSVRRAVRRDRGS